MTWAHLRAAWRNEIALGASPEVGRVFLRCKGCHRIVPAWQMVIAKPKLGDVIGCRCGHGFVSVTKLGTSWLGQLHAAWWLIESYVVRRVILRKDTWDPRLPLRCQ